MGPPPFGGGNPASWWSGIAATSGFNGATSFRRWKPGYHCEVNQGPDPLQWGHLLSAVETSDHQPLTVSNMALLQWGHLLSAVETGCTPCPGRSRRACFNGATSFRRWKPRKQPWAKVPGCCFNGATSFRRWKPRSLTHVPCNTSMLQWGHLLSAVETLAGCLKPVRNGRASMGPPPFGGGNRLSILSDRGNPIASMGPPPFGGGNLGTSTMFPDGV